MDRIPDPAEALEYVTGGLVRARDLRSLGEFGWMPGMEGSTRVGAASLPGDTTGFLRRMADGDKAARDEVFRRLYTELHRIACRVASRSDRDGTLQATDLIGEAYGRLIRRPAEGWSGRGHFLATAARAMKQVLIDHVRAREAEKRGGGRARLGGLDLDQLAAVYEKRTGGLIRFDEELEELRREEPELAQVVDLRFFAGYPMEEIAELLGTSKRTVERRWDRARAWLCARLDRDFE